MSQYNNLHKNLREASDICRMAQDNCFTKIHPIIQKNINTELSRNFNDDVKISVEGILHWFYQNPKILDQLPEFTKRTIKSSFDLTS